MELMTSPNPITSIALLAGSIASASATAEPRYALDYAPRVTNPMNNGRWFDSQITELKVALDAFVPLEADPVTPKTIKQLRAILETARRTGEVHGQIVPAADGSLQAEWHPTNAAVGVLVEDDGTASTWIRFIDTGDHLEEVGSAGIALFQTLVTQFRLNV